MPRRRILPLALMAVLAMAVLACGGGGDADPLHLAPQSEFAAGAIIKVLGPAPRH